MAAKVKHTVIYLLIGIILIVSVFSACALGSVNVPLATVIKVFGQQLFGVLNPAVMAGDVYVVWGLRFPRAILAVAVGGGLSVAGAAMQSITRNVMADPYTLGISSGALAFVSIGFLAGGPLAKADWFISIMAFGGAVSALLLVFAIGGFSKSTSPAMLVLSGMAVSVTLNAVAQYCIYQEQDNMGAGSIINWMMGSLGGARWDDVWIPLGGCLLGAGYFTWHARAFDLIALGDDTAISLGINTRLVKRISLMVVAVVAGLSVANCGIIGLVGFMIPHIVRFLIGTEHRRVFPLAFIVGGIFLVWMDIVARTAMAPQELPVGIFTALCGGPYFVWLLRKKKKGGF